jgi:O-antigen/teichoic acid export membrane protein
MIMRRFNSLPALVRGTALLTSGTVAGQLILFLALPVLTRIYHPTAFGILAVCMVVMSIIGVASCLRLEIAIPLPESDEDAANLLLASSIVATAVSVILLAAALLAPEQISRALGQPMIEPFLWVIAVGVMSSSINSVLTFWSLRQKRFGDIAQAQVVRSAGGAGTQLALGLAGFVPAGLLIGQLLYTVLGSGQLLRRAWQHEADTLRKASLRGALESLKENWRFPIFSVPGALLNATASHLPTLLIAAVVGPAEAGALLLAQRVSSVPAALVGQNVGRAFMAEAAERFRERRLAEFTRKTMRGLFLLAFLPFLALAVVAPLTFGLLFGADWSRAGIMVAWLVPAMLLQITVSPVSGTMPVMGKQHLFMLIHAAGCLMTVGAVIAAQALSPLHAFEFYAIATFLYYLLYLVAVFILTRQKA